MNIHSQFNEQFLFLKERIADLKSKTESQEIKNYTEKLNAKILEISQRIYSGYLTFNFKIEMDANEATSFYQAYANQNDPIKQKIKIILSHLFFTKKKLEDHVKLKSQIIENSLINNPKQQLSEEVTRRLLDESVRTVDMKERNLLEKEELLNTYLVRGGKIYYVDAVNYERVDRYHLYNRLCIIDHAGEFSQNVMDHVAYALRIDRISICTSLFLVSTTQKSMTNASIIRGLNPLNDQDRFKDWAPLQPIGLEGMKYLEKFEIGSEKEKALQKRYEEIFNSPLNIFAAKVRTAFDYMQRCVQTAEPLTNKAIYVFDLTEGNIGEQYNLIDHDDVNQNNSYAVLERFYQRYFEMILNRFDIKQSGEKSARSAIPVGSEIVSKTD